MTLKAWVIIAIFAPLLGALVAGLGAKKIGTRGATAVTIACLLFSLLAASVIFVRVVMGHEQFYGALYTWAVSGSFHFDIGFMVDALAAIMMLVVVFVSLLVHVYSIGYMAGDPGYQRFFSYMSLFTFAMLMLVSANNFFQLFFGWEGVGLVSYLLIGFWFERESAAAGSLKAFLINRVGDFGFILGIAAILDYFGTLDYQAVFLAAPTLQATTMTILPHMPWSIMTIIGILLFVGAMGKSAQMPLHVWLPESMEGPTPISALIHAATMVTAGVFMVARMAPLYDLSSMALSVVLVVGATTALFTGLLALVEFDIKRVIAFSTMSQLGYMMAADGAAAYSTGIFHLLTHACFKALLFLAAGAVIIALHHEQDMRKMGHLKNALPFTYAMFLVGALALSAIPPFSGFYSKDSIIEAVRVSSVPGASYAYVCLLIGAAVTAFYIFRAFFMTFHTKSRVDGSVLPVHATPSSMRFAMLILAIPTVLLGGWIVAAHVNVSTLIAMTTEAVRRLPFWFSCVGIVMAWLLVIVCPQIPVLLQRYLPWLHRLLVDKYGFDAFNWLVFVRGGRAMSNFFYRVADLKLLDDWIVDGTGRNATRISRWLRHLQSGYLYHYVLVMIVALLGFLVWFVWV